MKVMTVLGTRPEIIRLSRVIPLLDANCDHTLVHTGQNFDHRLSDIFFEEMGVRTPDIFLNIKGNSFGDQAGQILNRVEQALCEHKIERLLILGDTNSGLSSIVASRLGIPVYHMEAGNRCFDDRVPEEINRRIIDHSSRVLMPYTNGSRENLLREGIDSDRVYVTGNPIYEVIQYYQDKIDQSEILTQLGLKEKEYFLVTIHRAENVDNEVRLRQLTEALVKLNQKFDYPVVCSLHPRTRNKMNTFGLSTNSEHIRFLEPFGFMDFIQLERNAFCALSDSGTVQEECCIMGVPNVTVRDVTERPETIECGSNLLAGCASDTILRSVDLVTSWQGKWTPPPEYLVEEVAPIVAKVVLGYRIPDLSESMRPW
jgi:UDP-N-acetylglucosamine 2-epimerase (non-hydrolysing)